MDAWVIYFVEMSDTVVIAFVSLGCETRPHSWDGSIDFVLTLAEHIQHRERRQVVTNIPPSTTELRVPSVSVISGHSFISKVIPMVSIAANLRSTVDQNGGAVLNTSRNQITTLDAMGGYVWLRLEDGMTQEGIVRHLVQTTGEDFHVVERDIAELFAELQARNLIVDPGTNDGVKKTI